jgi:hypothetical protein
VSASVCILFLIKVGALIYHLRRRKVQTRANQIRKNRNLAKLTSLRIYMRVPIVVVIGVSL